MDSNEQMKFVFISHKNDVSPDAEICKKLYDYLTAHGICCWMDREDMHYGQWQAQITKKLYDASAFILVESKSSILSKQVQIEMNRFIGFNSNRIPARPFIPLALDNFCLELNEWLDLNRHTIDDEMWTNLHNVKLDSIQTVFLSKHKTEEEAFAEVEKYLPHDITRLKNNSADFVGDEGVLVKYTGHDSFVEIPSYIHIIGDEAFKKNSDITSVKIPGSVQKIGKRAFFGCKNLSQVDGMAGVREVDNYAFHCSCLIPKDNKAVALNGVLFGDDIPDDGELPVAITVAQNSFYGCTAKELEFKEGLKRVGEMAFTDCFNLKRIIFPSTLEEICKGAFSQCGKLEEVIFKGTPPKNVHEIFGQAKITEEK